MTRTGDRRRSFWRGAGLLGFLLTIGACFDLYDILEHELGTRPDATSLPPSVDPVEPSPEPESEPETEPETEPEPTEPPEPLPPPPPELGPNQAWLRLAESAMEVSDRTHGLVLRIEGGLAEPAGDDHIVLELELAQVREGQTPKTLKWRTSFADGEKGSPARWFDEMGMVGIPVTVNNAMTWSAFIPSRALPLSPGPAELVLQLRLHRTDPPKVDDPEPKGKRKAKPKRKAKSKPKPQRRLDAIEVIEGATVPLTVQVPPLVRMRVRVRKVELEPGGKYDIGRVLDLPPPHLIRRKRRSRADLGWSVWRGEEFISRSGRRNNRVNARWKKWSPWFIAAPEDALHIRIYDRDLIFDDLLADIEGSVAEYIASTLWESEIGSVRALYDVQSKPVK